MPGCSVEREVVGGTAWYRISGRFEGACAWNLTSKMGSEPLSEVGIDFSQVNDFSDYGIAVVASALLDARGKNVRLRGLRQHQERVFQCFGVDARALQSGPVVTLAKDTLPPLADKVA